MEQKKIFNIEFPKGDKIIFKKFFLLKEKRQFKRALKLLDFLESIYKDSSVIYGLYGSIFYELKDFKNSAMYFSKVISINPKSELASLGLFQSLVHLGKERKALKELFRYTDNYKPELYIVAIKELMEENIDGIGFNTDKKKIQNLYMKWCHLPSKSKSLHLLHTKSSLNK
jgi:tetratricopeptide (TPR) repeat protein